MNVSGVGTYQVDSLVSGAAERIARPGRDGRDGASAADGFRQAADTVTISSEARTKADEEKDKREVDQLRQDEERVKAHEAAHKVAGGQYAGSVSYSYRSGPDGKSYIVGGEVQIDVAPERLPQETISKMQVVISAAMAPADPSGQDRAVAAQAASQMAEAQQQKSAEGEEGASSGAVDTGSVKPTTPTSAGENTQGTASHNEQPQDAASRADRPSPPLPFGIYA
jgi:hypothetical protein